VNKIQATKPFCLSIPCERVFCFWVIENFHIHFLTSQRKNMSNNIVIVFDFDKTIIDCDSDNWVVDELGFTDLFNQLLPTMPFNSLMVCFSLFSYALFL